MLVIRCASLVVVDVLICPILGDRRELLGKSTDRRLDCGQLLSSVSKDDDVNAEDPQLNF